MIFDGIIRSNRVRVVTDVQAHLPSWQFFCNIGPFIPKFSMCLKHDFFFFRSSWVFVYFWVQMVVPPLQHFIWSWRQIKNVLIFISKFCWNGIFQKFKILSNWKQRKEHQCLSERIFRSYLSLHCLPDRPGKWNCCSIFSATIVHFLIPYLFTNSIIALSSYFKGEEVINVSLVNLLLLSKLFFQPFIKKKKFIVFKWLFLIWLKLRKEALFPAWKFLL